MLDYRFSDQSLATLPKIRNSAQTIPNPSQADTSLTLDQHQTNPREMQNIASMA